MLLGRPPRGRVRIPVLLLNCCVTLGKFLNLSEPQRLYQEIGSAAVATSESDSEAYKMLHVESLAQHLAFSACPQRGFCPVIFTIITGPAYVMLGAA